MKDLDVAVAQCRAYNDWSAAYCDTAPARLRGTAFGFFNLVSGVSMLLASVLAGGLWDALGSSATFHAGAVFAGFTALVLWRQR